VISEFARWEEIMLIRRAARAAAGDAVLAVVLSLALTAPAASAQARDRTPPTTPTNLRVTGTTPTSIALAWNPSTDNSGRVEYVLRPSFGFSVTVSGTSFNWNFALSPGQTYSFTVQAVDLAGNRSGVSNTATATTPLDTTPPTPPTLSVGSMAPVGNLVWTGSISPTVTVKNLTPSTTYSVAVRAVDDFNNASPPSNTVTVTTESNSGDTTPPSPPSNLTGFDGGCGEAWIRWTASTDNVDAPVAIRCEVYVNGVLAPESSTTGATRTVAYARVQGTNTFVLRAFDRAGRHRKQYSTKVARAVPV